MPDNLFADAPDLAPAENLFADAPALPPPPDNLFDEAPLDPVSPAGRQAALKAQEQEPTFEKARLGAALGAVEGFQDLKQSAGGILESGITSSPVERASRLGVEFADYVLGRTKRKQAPTAKEQLGAALSASAEKELGELGEAATELSGSGAVQVPRLLGSGIVSTAPSLVLAAFGGMPAAAYGAGMQSFGGTYQKAFKEYAKTMPEEEAKQKALMVGAASGLVTAGATRAFGGLERLFSKIGAGQLGKATVKGVLKQIGKSASMEIPEEGLDQLAQGILEQKTFNPDKTWAEIANDALIAAGVGGGVGLILGGIAAPTGAAINRSRRAQRLDQLRAARPGMVAARREARQEEEVRQDLVNRIMAVGKEEDAERITTTTPVPSDVLPSPGAQESQGQVPAAESSTGISPFGQGQVRQEARTIGELSPDEAIQQGVDYADYVRALEVAFRAEQIDEPTFSKRSQEAERSKWPKFAVGEQVHVSSQYRGNATVTGVGHGWIEVEDPSGRRSRQSNEVLDKLETYYQRHPELKPPSQPVSAPITAPEPIPPSEPTQEPPIAPGPVSAQARAIPVPEPLPVKLGKAKDFATSGNWTVTVGDKTTRMFKETESPGGWWDADEAKGRGTTEGFLGWTRAEAIKAIQDREAARIAQPAEQPAPPVLTPPDPEPVPEVAQPPPTPPSPPSAPPSAPPVDELPTLLARREELKRKILSDPSTPLPANEQAELLSISDRIQKLDPTRIPPETPVKKGRKQRSPKHSGANLGPPNIPLAGKVGRGTTVREALEFISGRPGQFAGIARQVLARADAKGLSVEIRQDPGADTSRYDPSPDEIVMAVHHAASDRVVLHETIHALTFSKLPLALRVELDPEMYRTALEFVLTGRKAKPTDAETPPAVIELIKLYKMAVDAHAKRVGRKAEDIIGSTSGRFPYGLTKLDEFMTEAMSNPEFQTLLKSIRDGRETLWQKFVRVIRQLLGLPVESEGILGQVMESTLEVAGLERRADATNVGQRSPEALVTDPSRRQDELVASSEIPSSQVREVNASIFTQNYATVGHAENSFRALSPEVQGFLPSIRSRYPTMYLAKAAIGQPAQGDLSTMVKATTGDPTQQQIIYFDAWQNVEEILNSRIRLARDIEKTRSEMEAEAKKGGTAGNPTQELISDATWHEINNLIAQRNAVVAAQGHPGALNQRIQDLKDWMHETPFYRVATAIVNGQPLNYQALGVDPVKGGIAAQVINGFPGLQAAISKAKAAAVPAPVAALEATLKQQEEALAWMDQLIASPEFKTNYEQARAAVGASLVMLNETEASVTFDDPITGEAVAVTFSSEDGVIGDGQTKIYNWLKNAQAYLALPPDQQDPLTAEGVRLNIRRAEEVYLNPSYSPSKSGKVYVGSEGGRKFNPFNLLTFGGVLATPESRLERAGGMDSALAQMHGQAYGMAHQMLQTKYQTLMNEVYLAVRKARKGHAKDANPITSDDQWIKQISDPVFASWQEGGSRHLKVGMKVFGRTITADDMNAIAAQKRVHDLVARVPTDVQTNVLKLFPLKIKIGGGDVLVYFRDPQATGGFTMPRYASRKAHTYSQEWRTIVKEPDKAKRRLAFTRYLGNTGHTQAFTDLVIGHMRSATDTPSYARLVGTPFLSQYRTMAQHYHEGNAGAPRSVSEVLNFIFQNQNVAPEKLMSFEQIADTLFAELTARFAAFDDSVPVSNAVGEPRSNVKVTSADNFLTTPRGEQILPSSLYEYSMADRDQHAKAVNAVMEVMGQRFVQAIEAWEHTLQDAITKFDNRIAELQRTGATADEAKAKVQAESRQAHLDGLNWYDYNEAVYQLDQARKSIEEMRKIAANERALENAPLKSGLRAFRSVVGGPLLETIGVVWRNYVGGPLKMIQKDLAYSKSIRIFRNSIDGGVSLPMANIVVSPVRRLGQVIKNTATLGIVPSILADKFFQGPRGQAMRAQMAANPQAFSVLGTILYNLANARAKRFEQMRNLGLAGGAPVIQQIEAYLKMFTTGGQIRKDGGSVGGVVTSLFGLLNETGIPGGHPGLPRSAFSRGADLSVNMWSGAELDSSLAEIQENALLYLGRRSASGHNSTQLLTPEELVGNKFATQKEATLLRNQWQKAGLNIDKKMRDYYDRVASAQAAGQPTDQVRILDDAEYNSLYMVYANEINKGSFMNRPVWFSTTELGRMFGMFRGYGFWDNARFRLALSQFSKSTDKLNAEGVGTVMLWLFWAIPLAAILGESINKLLTMWLYNEERQTPNPFTAESPCEAAKAMLVWMAPFEPVVGGVANSLVTGVTKGGKTSVSFIPTSFYDSTLNTARAIAQTGDAVRPVTSYVRQWFPNTRIALNRLPYNDGLTEYYNVNRTLRANTPSDIEARQFTAGGSYKLSPTSDNVQNVVNALNRPNGPDWQLVMRERDLGIEEKRKNGSARPEQSFDASVRAKMPFTAVYGRKLTEDEVGRIEARLNPVQLSKLRKVNAAFDDYSQRTGRSTSSSRARSTVTRRSPARLRWRSRGGRSARTRTRTSGRIRSSGRLRSSRNRSLRSSLR